MTERDAAVRAVSRRAVLAGVSAGIAGTLAGCLGDDRPDGVVLDPPEHWEQLRDAELAHPMYGDQLPEATVPAPLQERDVTTTEFVGERHSMFTFVFTRCPAACPLLTANLATVQADASENGYADEFAFLPTTFDPEYDTPSVIEEYSETRGADLDAGNWWFLRPGDESRAREVVDDTFGVAFERTEDLEDVHGNDDHGDEDHHEDGDLHEDDDHEDGDLHEDDDHEDGDLHEDDDHEDEDHHEDDDHEDGGLHEDDDHEHEDEDHDMEFLHTNLILLVNVDGYVERAYTGEPPNPADVLEEATTLRERW